MGGGTLQWAGNNTQDISNQLDLSDSNASAILDTNGNNVTLALPISGVVGLTKTGDGTLTLSGDNSSFSGNVTVSGGTLQAGSATALGDGTGGIEVDNGELDLNGYNITVGSLSGTGGTITDSSTTSGTSNLTVNQTSDSIFAGLLTNGANGRLLSLTTMGSGTLAALAQRFHEHVHRRDRNRRWNAGFHQQRPRHGQHYLRRRHAPMGQRQYAGHFIVPRPDRQQRLGHFGHPQPGRYVASPIGGYAGLVKTGVGMLVLSNANNNYWGGTEIDAGTLNFVSGALGSGNITFGGGTLQWAGGNSQDVSSQLDLIDSADSANLDTNGNNVTLAANQRRRGPHEDGCRHAHARGQQPL